MTKRLCDVGRFLHTVAVVGCIVLAVQVSGLCLVLLFSGCVSTNRKASVADEIRQKISGADVSNSWTYGLCLAESLAEYLRYQDAISTQSRSEIIKVLKLQTNFTADTPSKIENAVFARAFLLILGYASVEQEIEAARNEDEFFSDYALLLSSKTNSVVALSAKLRTADFHFSDAAFLRLMPVLMTRANAEAGRMTGKIASADFRSHVEAIRLRHLVQLAEWLKYPPPCLNDPQMKRELLDGIKTSLEPIL